MHCPTANQILKRALTRESEIVLSSSEVVFGPVRVEVDGQRLSHQLPERLVSGGETPVEILEPQVGVLAQPAELGGEVADAPAAVVVAVVDGQLQPALRGLELIAERAVLLL